MFDALQERHEEAVKTYPIPDERTIHLRDARCDALGTVTSIHEDELQGTILGIPFSPLSPRPNMVTNKHRCEPSEGFFQNGQPLGLEGLASVLEPQR